MNLPMEMMNPKLVDNGVASEAMEAKTLFMEPMGADTLGRFQLWAPHAGARAASAAVFASSSSCSTPQSSAKGPRRRL
jgi:hypothetical protein